MNFADRIRYLPILLRAYFRGGTIAINVHVKDGIMILPSNSMVLGCIFENIGVDLSCGVDLRGDE